MPHLAYLVFHSNPFLCPLIARTSGHWEITHFPTRWFLVLSHDVYFEAGMKEMSAKTADKSTGTERCSDNSSAFHDDLLIDALDLNMLDAGPVRSSKARICRVQTTY